MRTVWIFAAFVFLTGTARAADPLQSLTEDQRGAIFQLYTGYSDSLICNTPADIEVAGAYLTSKLGDKKITPNELAHYAFVVLAIHARKMTEMIQKGRAEKVIPEHCKAAERLYGPAGSAIPGLLKINPQNKRP